MFLSNEATIISSTAMQTCFSPLRQKFDVRAVMFMPFYHSGEGKVN